jgi:hypothetical protein
MQITPLLDEKFVGKKNKVSHIQKTQYKRITAAEECAGSGVKR